MTGYQLVRANLSGRSACSFVPDATAACEVPAVVHVLLSALPPAAAAAFCHTHWHEAHAGLRVVDFHRFGDHCNLPGSSWTPSSHGHRGTCLLPDDPTEAVERFANQPQGAPA